MISPDGEQTFAEGYHNALAQGIDPLEMLDAAWECPHGHLPGYTGTLCDCWATLAPVIDLPVALVFREAA